MNNVHNINLIMFNIPKAREVWIRFWFYGVFPPTEPMHLIPALSLWAEHTLSKCGGIDLPISTSESSESATMIYSEQDVTSFHY
jgi:hypothetical protein